ncbi:MAG: DUF4430 domain-containing protein [Firmicutes bacterium]|nr:DUF4430 domain-containing protein [Bacillota bacterium]
MKRRLLAAVTAALMVLCLCACGTENGTNAEEQPVTGTCTISVDDFCDDMKIDIHEGDTVYDVLVATGAELETSDTGSGTAIDAINGIENGSEGPMSGWMYEVNDETPMDYCDKHEVSDGDDIEWDFSDGM